MHGDAAVRAPAENLGGTVPLQSEHLVVLTVGLVLPLEGSEGALLVPEVPQLDAAVVGTTQEYVLHVVVELDLRDPLVVGLVL